MTNRPKQPTLTAAWIVAVLLLLFNGLGAIYGGINLINHPNGSSIGLDLKLLKDSPFSNYYVPGIILLTVNGIIDTAILIATFLRLGQYYIFVIGQGVLLGSWLIIQLILIHTFDKMHFIMGATAVCLILSGIVQRRYLNNSQNAGSRHMTRNSRKPDYDQL